VADPNEAAARRALEEYQAKIARELAPPRREARSGGAGGLPGGEPDCGVLLVLESPHTPAVLDALRRSLDSVGHPEARVVPVESELLEEILSAGPAVIVAVGPGAARALDGLEYPLAHARFSEAREGEWFAWSKGARGLALPALAPALEAEEAKRNFWRAFLALRALETA
jgi:hypothetical protein